MESMESGNHGYPGEAIEREVTQKRPASLGGIVAAVDQDSPASRAGIEPGFIMISVDGHPLRDILDWSWYGAEETIVVEYLDARGQRGSATLDRREGEPWGISFDGAIFDGVRRCHNRCSFCFMTQLPAGLRPSLYVRDDDFRLSFLSGTFITGTNMDQGDVDRILEQQLTPLRFSLHGVDPSVRERLMGPAAPQGMVILKSLLEAGVDCHCQIVLVPGVNDGDRLRETLDWAIEQSSILTVGIVPLGYTAHQDRFTKSFNEPSAAKAVIESLLPYQERAWEERNTPWVFASDEFYRNGYGLEILEALPPAEFYGDFDLFEDGVGIIRTVVDDWARAEAEGIINEAERASQAAALRIRPISGLAQQEYLDALIRRSAIGSWFVPLYVENSFFGGNVDVTGLLCGEDIATAIRRESRGQDLFLIPSIIFNDDGLTLDGWTIDAMEAEAGVPLTMVSLSPLTYFDEIAVLASSVLHT